MNLGCERIRLLLDGWLDNELDAETAGELRDHLAFCESCRIHFGRHARIDADLRRLGEAADRIAASPASAVRSRRTVRRWQAPAAAAAAAVLLVSGYLVFRGGAPRSPQRAMDGGMAMTDERNVQLVEHGPAESVFDGPRVRLRNMPNSLAVPVESANPRIHIVWIVAEPAPTDTDSQSLREPNRFRDACALRQNGNEICGPVGLQKNG